MTLRCHSKKVSIIRSCTISSVQFAYCVLFDFPGCITLYIFANSTLIVANYFVDDVFKSIAPRMNILLQDKTIALRHKAITKPFYFYIAQILILLY